MLQSRFDILSRTDEWTRNKVNQLLNVEVGNHETDISKIVVEYEDNDMTPFYKQVLLVIGSHQQEDRKIEKNDFSEEQIHFMDFVKNLNNAESKDKGIIENPLLQSLVMHSLAISLGIKKHEDFPYNILYNSLLKGTVEDDISNLELFNFDFAECIVFGQNKKNKLEANLYRCKSCDQLFYHKKTKKCLFCRKEVKKMSAKKYAKKLKAKKKQGLRINPLVEESIALHQEQDIISFRVLHLFRNCVLLGLRMIFPEESDALFKADKGLKKIERLDYFKRSHSIEEYLEMHIQSDLNYLKRIFKLKIKPFHLVHTLFIKLGDSISDISKPWYESKISELEQDFLKSISRDLQQMPKEIVSINKAELESLKISNPLHILEKDEQAAKTPLIDSKISDGVFEVHALKEHIKLSRHHIMEELLLGKLDKGFLKEIYNYKDVLTGQVRIDDQAESENKQEINFFGDFITTMLELSKNVAKIFEVEYNKDDLVKQKFKDCIKTKFGIETLDLNDAQDDNDLEDNQKILSDVLNLYFEFKENLTNLLTFARKKDIMNIFPFILSTTRPTDKEINSRGEFKQLSTSTITNLIQNDDFTLGMLLIHSQLARVSLVMRFCRCLGDFQNFLIRKHGEESDRRVMNIFNLNQENLNDFIILEKDFMDEDFEDTIDLNELMQEVNSKLCAKVLGNLPVLVTESREHLQYRFREEKEKSINQLETLRRRFEQGSLSESDKREIRTEIRKSQEVRLTMFEHIKRVVYILICKVNNRFDQKIGELMNFIATNAQDKPELNVINKFRVCNVVEIYLEIEGEVYFAKKELGELNRFDSDLTEKGAKTVKKKFVKELSNDEKDMLEWGLKRLAVRVMQRESFREKLVANVARRHLHIFRNAALIEMEKAYKDQPTNRNHQGKNLG